MLTVSNACIILDGKFTLQNNIFIQESKVQNILA
jgi:hypothetical protein